MDIHTQRMFGIQDQYVDMYFESMNNALDDGCFQHVLLSDNWEDSSRLRTLLYKCHWGHFGHKLAVEESVRWKKGWGLEGCVTTMVSHNDLGEDDYIYFPRHYGNVIFKFIDVPEAHKNI